MLKSNVMYGNFTVHPDSDCSFQYNDKFDHRTEREQSSFVYLFELEFPEGLSSVE